MVELLQEVRWKVKRCALRLQAGPGCPVGIEAQIKDAFAFVKAPISFFGAGVSNRDRSNRSIVPPLPDLAVGGSPLCSRKLTEAMA